MVEPTIIMLSSGHVLIVFAIALISKQTESCGT